MKRIDLRYLYPDRYQKSYRISVSDEVYRVLKNKKNNKIINSNNDNSNIYYYDPILLIYRKDLIFKVLTKLNELSLKQQNRIYEKYILGLNMSQIARIEGCNESAVRKSIKRGLMQLRRKMNGHI